MNRDQLNDRNSAAIRRHARGLADSDGKPPLALLDDLAGIADEHGGGEVAQELRDSLEDLGRRHDRLLKAYQALTDQVITGLATTEHDMVVEAGLPFCRCGESLAGGDAKGSFITHALAVLSAARAEPVTGGGEGERDAPPLVVTPGAQETRTVPAKPTTRRTSTRRTTK